MAKILDNDEERDRRIKLVGEYIIDKLASVRGTQKYLKEEHNIKISATTVHDYVNRYIRLKYVNYEKLIDIMIKNSSRNQSIDKEEVQERVNKVIEHFKDGYNIEQISKLLKVSFWVIYGDLRRFRKMNPDSYERDIKPKLYDDSLKNLKHGK